MAVRLGVVGLGRAFMLSAPALLSHPSVKLVAACDPRPEPREQAARELGVAVHEDAEALCRRDDVDAVYVASPHQHHVAHVAACARHGKHVLVEKPMALTLDDCDRMIEAAERGGVALVVGPTHSFDAPVRAARALIRDGSVGTLRMIAAWAYTDYLYRPRRPEELDTAQGGGVMFSQAPHQVDVVRLLAGGLAASVTCVTGAWDPARPTEGAYSALLRFAGGAVATLVYSGYAHFDGDELHGWIGESGEPRSPRRHGEARRLLAQRRGDDEARVKGETGFGGPRARPLRPAAVEGLGHPHLGTWIASCDRADLRATPHGLAVYRDTEVELPSLPVDAAGLGRTAVLDELVEAMAGRPHVHTGRWGKATLEVCLAMLESARTGREIALRHQVAPDEPASAR